MVKNSGLFKKGNWVILLGLSLWFCMPYEGFSQRKSFEIYGEVTDAQGTPVPFATVYVNNTSYNTYCDSVGHYQLKVNVSTPKLELVAGMVGFKTSKVLLESNGINKRVTFRLETLTELDEILVKSKMDKFWRKKWRIFEEGLLGEPARRAQCTLLNPEVIQLDYDEKEAKVKAFSREPLQILNKKLGYKVTAQINYFESDGRVTFLASDKYFDSLEVYSFKHYRRLIRNRMRVYENSFRSFLVSLAEGNSEEQGFVIFQTREIRNDYVNPVYLNDTSNTYYAWQNPDSLITSDTINGSFTLKSPKSLLVVITSVPSIRSPHADYPYAYSQIELPAGSFSFDRNGWLINQNGLILYNYWGKEGLANLLPDDYDTHNKKDFLLKMDIETMAPINKRARKEDRLPERLDTPVFRPQP